MKKLLLISLLALLTNFAFAQKYVPAIKVGTVFSYEVFLRNAGQRLPISLTVKTLGDPMNIGWSVVGLGTGTFAINAKAQESGTKIAVRTPEADDVTKLKDDETFLTVSKSTFNSMVNNQPFVLNGMQFTVVANDTTVYRINDKVAPILHAIGANKKSELWVLNNPDFPLICGENSVAKGIDLTLLGIKE
jgi:hypothetical protein